MISSPGCAWRMKAPIRLVSTWRSRPGSPSMRAGRLVCTWVISSTCFSSARSRNRSTAPISSSLASRASRLMSAPWSDSCEYSSTSLMILSRLSPALRMPPTQSFWLGVSGVSSRISAMPRMPLSGVRTSCPMRARVSRRVVSTVSATLWLRRCSIFTCRCWWCWMRRPAAWIKPARLTVIITHRPRSTLLCTRPSMVRQPSTTGLPTSRLVKKYRAPSGTSRCQAW